MMIIIELGKERKTQIEKYIHFRNVWRKGKSNSIRKRLELKSYLVRKDRYDTVAAGIFFLVRRSLSRPHTAPATETGRIGNLPLNKIDPFISQCPAAWLIRLRYRFSAYRVIKDKVWASGVSKFSILYGTTRSRLHFVFVFPAPSSVSLIVNVCFLSFIFSSSHAIYFRCDCIT